MILDDMRHGNYIVIRRRGEVGIVLIAEKGGYFTIGNNTTGLCITINSYDGGYIFNSSYYIDFTTKYKRALCSYMIDYLDDMYCVIDRYICNGNTTLRSIIN